MRHKAAPDTLSAQADTSKGYDDRISLRTNGYTYKGTVDYDRIVKQASRTFKDFVRSGSESSKELFLSSIEMLTGYGRAIYQQEANLGYLLKDPVYSEIRNAFIKERPDDDIYDFLDAIDSVRKNGGGDFGFKFKYGKEFIDAVLKHSQEKK
jgi:hypothetical protein